MNSLSRFVLVFIFLSFDLAAGGLTPGKIIPGQVVSGSGFSGIVLPAAQRSRAASVASAKSGYSTVTISGADDITEVHLRGRSVTFKTVRGTRPRNVTADFSAAIPPRSDLVLGLKKLRGRGNVSISGRPAASNNYTVIIRVTDSPRGMDDYTLRLDWSLPGAAAASASRALGTPAQSRAETVSRTQAGSTPSRVTRTPSTAAVTSSRQVPSRIRNSRMDREGYVEVKLDGIDDVVDIQVSGDKVFYKTVRGRNPVQVNAEFSTPVPRDASISLNITKSYGRGSISLAERPVAANNYTTTVRLADTRSGSGNYKFRLNWSDSGSSRGRTTTARTVASGSFPVKDGHVVVIVDGADDILDIRLRGDKVVEHVVKGATARKITSEFSTPIPLVKITDLDLQKVYGRGSVVIMDWPDQSNDFTTTIRIIDSRKAQDNYRFRLTWKVSGNSSSAYAQPAAVNGYDTSYSTWVELGNYQRIPAYTGSSFQYTKEGSFRFRAVVDDTALVKIAGGELWGLVESGKPMHVLDARFSEGFPNGEMERLEITGFRGRGDLEILERPWSGNNYSIVIRINDSRGGDAEYDFELSWKQK